MPANSSLIERSPRTSTGSLGSRRTMGARGINFRCASHSALVELIEAGYEEAWTEMVSRFTPLVMAAARRAGLSHADAADAAQATWIQLLRSLRSIRNPECLPGWLAHTAKRECVRVAMASARVTPSADPERDGPRRFAPAAEATVIDRHLDGGIADAIESVPENYRNLLALLSCDAEFTYAEIAGRLDVAVGSVGPMRQRALGMVRSRMTATYLHDTEGL